MDNIIVWIDLEETIIDSWYNCYLRNVYRLRNLIVRFDVKQINIFSYAIWNDDDKLYFRKDIQDDIESSLGISVNEVLSIVEIKNKVEKHYGYVYNGINDFIHFEGKFYGFLKYINSLELSNCKVILVDDAVQNSTLKFSKKNLEIEFINIYTV